MAPSPVRRKLTRSGDRCKVRAERRIFGGRNGVGGRGLVEGNIWRVAMGRNVTLGIGTLIIILIIVALIF
ncbi:MAG: hypothetical protein V4696_08095 [Pseudomonadota bacterium]